MELQVPTGQYESAFELDLQPVVQVFAFTTCNLVHCTTKRGYHCQYSNPYCLCSPLLSSLRFPSPTTKHN